MYALRLMAASRSRPSGAALDTASIGKLVGHVAVASGLGQCTDDSLVGAVGNFGNKPVASMI